ncbi:hypothetical protein GCM10012289_65030 [Nonomuraea cavernae]|uniref:Uncharacterized protein n=1 Tax=Nonomuraea cavernae TaxID=2045107 RepID=A0A918DQA2_9ACTN|nr:hypothetical protein GCM10012289_65030 [Nonomuraea cavernae]
MPQELSARVGVSDQQAALEFQLALVGLHDLRAARLKPFGGLMSCAPCGHGRLRWVKEEEPFSPSLRIAIN